MSEIAIDEVKLMLNMINLYYIIQAEAICAYGYENYLYALEQNFRERQQ